MNTPSPQVCSERLRALAVLLAFAPLPKATPVWRNGRRTGLKILGP